MTRLKTNKITNTMIKAILYNVVLNSKNMDYANIYRWTLKYLSGSVSMSAIYFVSKNSRQIGAIS